MSPSLPPLRSCSHPVHTSSTTFLSSSDSHKNANSMCFTQVPWPWPRSPRLVRFAAELQGHASSTQNHWTAGVASCDYFLLAHVRAQVITNEHNSCTGRFAGVVEDGPNLSLQMSRLQIAHFVNFPTRLWLRCVTHGITSQEVFP